MRYCDADHYINSYCVNAWGGLKDWFTGVPRKGIILGKKRLFYFIYALWFLILTKICLVELSITWLSSSWLNCFFYIFPLLNVVIGCKRFLFRTEINTLSVDVLSSDPCPFLHPFRYLRAQRSTSSRETSPSPARSRRRRFPMAMSTSLTGPRRSTGQSPPSLSWGLLKISTSKWEKVCTGFPKFPT